MKMSQPEPEPSAEPTSQSEPTSQPEPSAEPTSQPEPSAEPTSQPEPSVEPTSLPEPSAEPTSHPEPTPQPEPTSQPEPTARAEPNVVKTLQPEPSAEPTSQSETTTLKATTLQPESNTELPTGHEISAFLPTIQPEMTEEAKTKQPEAITEHPTEVTSKSSEPTAEPGLPIEWKMNKTMERIEMQTESHAEDILNNVEATIIPEIKTSALMTTTTPQPIITKVIHEGGRQSKLAEHDENINLTHERETTMAPQPEEERNADITTAKHVLEELRVVNETNISDLGSTKLAIENLTKSNEVLIPLTTEIIIVTTEEEKTEETITEKEEETATEMKSHVIPVEVNSAPKIVETDTFNLLNTVQSETTTDHVPTTLTSIIVNNHTQEILEGFGIINGSTETNEIVTNETTHQPPVPQTTSKSFILFDTVDNANILEHHMSPFLPEIENDTLIDMHSMEHVNNETEMTYDFVQSTKSPRLDNDEMNTTNPFDLNPVDVGLSVIPLSNNETTASPKAIDVHNATGLSENINEIPLTSSADLQFTTSISEVQPTTTPVIEMVTKSAAESSTTPNMTLSPLILNNIHSNHFFETITKDMLKNSLLISPDVITTPINGEETTKKLDLNDRSTTQTESPSEITTINILGRSEEEETNAIESSGMTAKIEEEMTSKTEEEATTVMNIEESQENTIHVNDQKDLGASTEDLVAMETTTNVLNRNQNQEHSTNPVPAIGIKGHNIRIEDMSTVQGNIIQTITETVHFVEDSSVRTAEHVTSQLPVNIVDNETVTEAILPKSTVNEILSAKEVGNETTLVGKINESAEVKPSTNETAEMTTTKHIPSDGVVTDQPEKETVTEKLMNNVTINEISLNGTPTEAIPLKAEEKLESDNATATETVVVKLEDVQNDTIPLKIQNVMETIPLNSTTHQYEVFEPIVELTTPANLIVLKTTEKKPEETTTPHDIIQPGGDDEALLSVIPLPTKNEISKLDKKRVAEEESFNKLDNDSNNLNIISEEEASVLEKFNHQINDIHDESDLVTTQPPRFENDLSRTETILYKPISDKNSKKNAYINEKKELYDKKMKSEKQLDLFATSLKESDVIINVTTTTIAAVTDQPTSNEKFEENIKPVTEGFTLIGFSRCAIGQFQCVNGTSLKDGSYCIPRSDRCDSVDDCSDASDEEGCVEEGCPNNFQCASGQCLKRHLVCDGILNCNDGSDEMNCDTWECNFDEFQCEIGGRCVPLSWKCDGRSQCPNSNDEYNCHQALCDNNEFQCVQQDTCIPLSWRCDGKSDCLNDEDERLCDCGIDQFKCVIGGGCISLEHRCDGFEQCADRSDEWGCIKLAYPEFMTLDRPDDPRINGTFLQVLISNNTWHPVCSESWNATYSDMVCRSLGYAEATLTEYSKPTNGHDVNPLFKLKPVQQYGSNLLTQLEKTDKCDNVVSLICQEFSCGSYSTLDVQSARIISGSSATEMQWPSVTLLYNRKRNVQCTASLISPSWVIASYSCVLGTQPISASTPKDWTLYAGGSHFFNNADNSSTQTRTVQDIIPHPKVKYGQFEFDNDAVLMELAVPLTLGRNVSAICLPDKALEPRQLCVTAGWGVSKPGDSNVQKYLHYLPVPTIDPGECNSTKHYNGHVSSDKICAGYTESDKTPCYNDEGAPLMCFSEETNMWELYGILSHHSNCGRTRHPSIYASINSSMRDWIANTIGSKAVQRSS